MSDGKSDGIDVSASVGVAVAPGAAVQSDGAGDAVGSEKWFEAI